MEEETEYSEKEEDTQNSDLKEENIKLRSQLINMQVREELKDEITFRLSSIAKQESINNELKQVNENLVKIGKNLNILCKLLDKKK